MLVVVPQTREEKIAMYMKSTKREPAEMLAEANLALAAVDRNLWSLVTDRPSWYQPEPVSLGGCRSPFVDQSRAG